MSLEYSPENKRSVIKSNIAEIYRILLKTFKKKTLSESTVHELCKCFTNKDLSVQEPTAATEKASHKNKT